MVNYHSCVKIVLNLVFNDEGKVLLIQEAKDHSRGLWFLPAGKVKEGESILEGLQRETIEESGIEAEFLSLFKVEHIIRDTFSTEKPNYVDIFRFIIVSKPKITTKEPKDYETKDSIQAKWFSIQDVFDGVVELRSYEVVELLEDYIKNKEKLYDIKESISVFKYGT